MFKIWKRITAGLAAGCCLMTIIPSTIFASAADSIKYEAEDGVIISGAAEVDEDSAASGGKYMKLTHSFDVEYEVTVDEAGYYDFFIVAKSNISDQLKINYISTEDGRKSKFIVENSEYETVTATNVKLSAGKNTVSIENYYGYVDVDCFTIEKSETSTRDYYSTVSSTLVNPNAIASTKRLMKYLCDSYGTYTISGQQSDTGYESTDVKAIKNLTGELPAIIGLDLMDYSLSSVEQHEATSAAIERAIDVSNAGGIVTFCWHWRMYDEYLKSGTDGGSPRWWGAFYTKNVDLEKFDLAAIMDDPTCEEYKLLVKDIDYVAEQLKRLQDADVPVLFRPLHEGGGNYESNGSNAWFWWGTGGSEAYIKLWRLMYDRITNVAGVNNLIWVWNGQVPSYYPGDEYVDIISEDIYNSANDNQPNAEKFFTANEYTDASKIVALSETGTLMDPDEAFDINAKWSYFCSWTGQYSALGEYNNADDRAIWKKVYNSDKVITLSELPNLKTYPIDDDIPATSVSLNSSEQDIMPGDKIYLAATFAPQNATEIPTWTSSDTSVATVNESGAVTAIGIGETVITCTIANGKTATCVVTVNPPQVQNLAVKSSTGSSVTLTWDAIEAADDYEVMIMDEEGKELNTVVSDSNTFEVKGLDAATTYKFRVRAHKNTHDRDLYGDYSSIVIGKTSTSTDPIEYNTDSSKSDDSIITINTNGNGSNSSNNADNSANTGSKALTTFGLSLAGAYVILVAKKRK